MKKSTPPVVTKEISTSGNIIEKTLALGKRAAFAMRDGWENLYTGLGVQGVDKRTGAKIRYKRMVQAGLEEAHDADDIAHKVVNLVPDEGTLKWLEHKIEGKAELIKLITDFEDNLKIKDKFNKAWKWARLYGGAGIYLSIDDGLSVSEPVNFLRIRNIRSMVVLHKFQLTRGRLNDNIDDPNFGMPEFYSISGAEGMSVENIHHSRIIRFEGAELSEQAFIRNDYWNDSVIPKLYEILADYNSAYASVAHTIQDFNIRVMKLKDLADIIGSDDTDVVAARLKVMNLSKSIIGCLLLDADAESIENLSTNLSGLDKVLEKLDQRLVMATNMPHTIILGDGSTGTLSGAGESEDKIFKGMVAKEQEKVLREPYEYFCKLMFAAKFGPTKGQAVKDHTWEFRPLWEPSQKEVVANRKTVAETDQIYVNMQAISSLDVTKSRFGGDQYSIETTVDIAALETQIETENINSEETEALMRESQRIANEQAAKTTPA